ncbi:hypothetical protein ABW19_dt0204781 [Dactylella cylindrospora]|nr:hypothetical protein ABW19_dt0204781 [Dactylella cylindrospora]
MTATGMKKPIWYKEAMGRRLETSATIAILNSRNPHSMIGRIEFIRRLLQQASRHQFWISRQGHSNRQAGWAIPTNPEKFPGWAIEHLDVLQSKGDPIVFCQASEAPKGMTGFRGFKVPTVLFHPIEPPKTSEEAGEAEKVEPVDTALEEDQSLETNTDPTLSTGKAESAIVANDTHAAETIQKNWRIYSKLLRDKRYRERHPTHRRITQILEEPALSAKLVDDAFEKCFRMAAFVLLESIADTKIHLNKMATKLEAVCRRGLISMETTEKILVAHDLVSDYGKRLAAVEKVMEPPSLANLAGKGSIIKAILQNVKNSQTLLEKTMSRIFELDQWAHREL